MADESIISGTAPPGADNASLPELDRSNAASVDWQQELQELKTAFQEFTRHNNDEIAVIRSERDSAAAELKAVRRQQALTELAAASNFPDIEYLDFVLQKHHIDPGDPASSSEFLQKFQSEHPYCQFLPITPGAGSRPGQKSMTAVNSAKTGKMEMLEDMLSGAPEII
ncbi:MAG: hypothetical protein E7052_07265 [Lentisphaerae bacterium]|nr:hypothetical protein [Lentisphaerota bacterium]